MTATAASPQTFTGEELGELLALMGQADSVELKLTVPDLHHRPTAVALGIDPLEAQIRQIFFFETPDLALNEVGLVVRARRIQGKGGDTAVKLRPVIPNELPDDLRRLPDFRVEVDALPGGFVCSGTLKSVADATDVRAVAEGRMKARKLFSKEQRRYFAAHAPEGLALDDLRVFGPIFVLKLRLTPPELRRRLVTEVWLYPDGSRVVELSTRCGTTEAFQAAAECRAFLASHGVDVTGEQQTKTKLALEYFAEHVS